MRQTVTKTTSGPEIDGGDERLALCYRKKAESAVVGGELDARHRALTGAGLRVW